MLRAVGHDDLTRGATAMIFGVGFFAVHDMVGKLVVENYPVAQMLALRSGIALLVLVAITVRRGGLPPLPRASQCPRTSSGSRQCSGRSFSSSAPSRSCHSPTRPRSRSARRS